MDSIEIVTKNGREKFTLGWRKKQNFTDQEKKAYPMKQPKTMKAVVEYEDGSTEEIEILK